MLKQGLYALLFGLGLTACGGGEYADVETPHNTVDTIAVDTLPSDVVDRYEEIVETRLAQGDTVAIAPKILQDMMVDSIPGWSKEIDRAETFVTRNFTFSEGTKVFYDPSGENYIEFIAGDYAANPDFFEVVLQRYQLASGFNLDGVTDRKLSVEAPAQAEAFIGWESFNANRRLAEIHFAYDYRYFVSVTATGKSDFLNAEQVSQWVDWTKLPN